MFRPPLMYRAARPMVKGLFKSLFNIECSGLDNLPKENKSYMVIANHQSWIDPILVMAYLSSKTEPVVLTEKNTTSNPVIDKVTNLVGNPVIEISRSDNKSRTSGMREMMSAVKKGKVLVVFPEGRVSRAERDMYPFYPGAFLISKKLNLPIVPFGIAGNFELYLRTPISINIGAPIYPQNEEAVEDYAARAYYYLQNEVLPLYPGDGPSKKYCTWLTDLFLNGRAPDNGNREPVIRYKNDKNLFKHFS